MELHSFLQGFEEALSYAGELSPQVASPTNNFAVVGDNARLAGEINNDAQNNIVAVSHYQQSLTILKHIK